jgi:hypothetical protein
MGEPRAFGIRTIVSLGFEAGRMNRYSTKSRWKKSGLF